MGFHTWVNDGNTSAIQSDAGFRDDSQRQTGFQSGTPASSIRVNSALRQANLVACALMDAVGITTDYAGDSLVTARDTLSSHLNTALNTKLAYVKLSGSSEITGSLVPKTTNQVNLGHHDRAWNNIYCKDLNFGGVYLTQKINQLETHDSQTFNQQQTIWNEAQTNPVGKFKVEIQKYDAFYIDTITLTLDSPLTITGGRYYLLMEIYTPLKDDKDELIPSYVDDAQMTTRALSIRYQYLGSSGQFYIDYSQGSGSVTLGKGTYIGRYFYIKP